MMTSTKLSKDFTKGNDVWKITLEGVDVQFLDVDPHTSINLHGHDNQWEVTLLFSPWMRAYVCLKDEEHELVNNTDKSLKVMTLKGSSNYLYDELEAFFYRLGFSVYHESLIINEG